MMGTQRRVDFELSADDAFQNNVDYAINRYEVSFLRRRFFAFLIDSFIAAWISGLVSVVTFAVFVFALQNDDDFVILAVLFSSLFITYYSYQLFFWTAWGATPGKLILKLRVVDAEGREIRFLRSLLRMFGYIVSLCTFCIGFFRILLDPYAQGLHDKIAGTYVVYEAS